MTCIITKNVTENRVEIIVTNTGDCRLIICQNNNAIPITKDHKPYYPEEKYRIQKQGGVIQYDGTEWRIGLLSVSRTYGDLDTKYITHIPEIFRFEYNKDIKFIVMGCDGLWDVMTNQEVVNFILEHCYDNSTVIHINKEINCAKLLAQHAIKKQSTDNVSIIIIFFD